jgi:hypothetical protein
MKTSQNALVALKISKNELPTIKITSKVNQNVEKVLMLYIGKVEIIGKLINFL